MADRTADTYRRHHETGRYGFTIDGEDRGRWFAARIEEVAKALGKSRLDVLDVGCRDGTLTKYYAGAHAVRGLDVDQEAVRRANEAGIEARAIDLNREDFPFGDTTFDVVVAGEVLEHLQWPTNVVKDVHRVLRDGGRFIGTVPNAFRLRNRVLFLMGRDFEVDPTHLHWYSPDALKKMLSAFRDVSLEYHGGHRRNLHPKLMASQMHWVAIK